MKVPFSWLKQYVDIDVTAQELEDKLFGCGFEVEELIDLVEVVAVTELGDRELLVQHVFGSQCHRKVSFAWMTACAVV